MSTINPWDSGPGAGGKLNPVAGGKEPAGPLKPGFLQIRVKTVKPNNKSEPVTGANVELKPAAPGGAPRTNADGMSEIPNLKPGAYQVTVKAQGYESAQANAVVQSEKTSKVDIKLRTQWIEIAVVGDKGEPIANVNYALTLGDGKSVTGKTDAEGKLYLDELPPGNVKLSFPDLDDDAWASA